MRRSRVARRRIAATRPARRALAAVVALAAACVAALACSPPPAAAPRTGATAAAARPAAPARVAASAPPASATRADPLTARMRVYEGARAALRSGDVDGARQGFQRSEDVLPELADYALFDGARLAAAAGDTATARAKLDRIVVEHQDSVWFAAAAVERGRIALDAGAAGEAAGLFDRALASGDAAAGDSARLGKAQALAALGDRAGAYALVDELRGKGGAVGDGARVLGEALEADGPAALGQDPAELRLRVARARLREGRTDEAAEALSPLLEPASPRRGDALLVLARIRARQGDVEAAFVAYSEASRTSRDPEVAGTAIYEHARILWNRDDDDAAGQLFESLVARFPDHPKAPEAMHALGRIAEVRSDHREAARLYEEAARRQPDAAAAREMAWRAGFVRYLAGDHAAAAASFAALGDDDEAVYWRARSLEAAGDRDAARSLYESVRARSPRGHLAWWVDRRLGEESESAAAEPGAGDLPQPPAPLAATPPPLGGVAAYHYGRGEILRALGLRDDAAREYAAVEAASGPEPMLLDLYHDAGAYPAMLRLARRLDTRGDPVAQAYLYPPAFAATFERAGERSGVDPLLLYSVSRQESLFDPRALSPAGARGLMQLMPATAAAVGGPGVDAAALAVPDTNVDVGARYLRTLLDRHDGRIVPALAAYNAGPDAVARWEMRSFGRDGDEFVELISYRETKGYVKAVLRNYRSYRSLHPERATAPVRLY